MFKPSTAERSRNTNYYTTLRLNEYESEPEKAYRRAELKGVLNLQTFNVWLANRRNEEFLLLDCYIRDNNSQILWNNRQRREVHDHMTIEDLKMFIEQESRFPVEWLTPGKNENTDDDPGDEPGDEECQGNDTGEDGDEDDGEYKDDDEWGK